VSKLNFLEFSSSFKEASENSSAEVHRFETLIPELNASNLGIVFPPYNYLRPYPTSLPDSKKRLTYPYHDIQELVETAARLGFRNLVTQHMILPLFDGLIYLGTRNIFFYCICN